LMRVKSTDVAAAYSDYRQAVASETLAKTQLDRANLLLQKGAIAKKDQEIAADTEIKARVIRETAVEKLRVLGVTDLNRHPDGIVDIVAPISGIVTEQNIAEGSAVKTLDNSPNLFTIANLDRIWIVCDVYENSSSFIQVGEYADVRLNAYPDKVFKGRISNISPILDSNTRTAKVRIEIQNPGFMRIGMFATATFHGREQEKYAVIPASSILHLRDRQWVFVPEGKGKFRRTEVVGGKMLEAGMQQVKGLMPGQQVVADALRLQNMAEE
jgi:membrane fusion protein, heavy metal efflux system